MDRINLINENLIGTNNINYKHCYFLSYSELFDLKISTTTQKTEIGDIGWFSYTEAKQLIRPYHINRLNLLDEIFIFLAHNLRYYITINKI